MTSADELHVVFGSGPVGQAVVDALLSQGKRVRVASRSGARRGLPSAVDVATADATDPEDTRRACAGATHVYNCTNPPDYHRWPEQFPPLQRGVLAGAAAAGARLVAMENLYMYGPHGGRPMSETTPMNGRGPRSDTRRRMTDELFEAHREGRVRAASVRAADLLGPRVTESLVGERFFGPLLAEKTIQVLADPDLPHTVSVVADVGRAMVAVGASDAGMGRVWHAPNPPTVSLRALARIAGEEAGVTPRLTPVRRALARVLLPLMGLVVPPLRGLSENLYQFYEPYVVDHGAYAAAFGDDATPLRDAIAATVRWYRTERGRTMGAPAPAAGVGHERTSG